MKILSGKQEKAEERPTPNKLDWKFEKHYCHAAVIVNGKTLRYHISFAKTQTAWAPRIELSTPNPILYSRKLDRCMQACEEHYLTIYLGVSPKT